MGNTDDRNRGLQALGLVFEFLGILAVTPFLGYLVDRFLLDATGPGIGFFFGLAVGFAYGLWHLIRRALVLVSSTGGPDSAEAVRRARNREGYDADVSGRAESIRGGLDNVGRHLDRLGPSARRSDSEE